MCSGRPRAPSRGGRSLRDGDDMVARSTTVNHEAHEGSKGVPPSVGRPWRGRRVGQAERQPPGEKRLPRFFRACSVHAFELFESARTF
jgi:hypothetical protein